MILADAYFERTISEVGVLIAMSNYQSLMRNAFNMDLLDERAKMQLLSYVQRARRLKLKQFKSRSHKDLVYLTSFCDVIIQDSSDDEEEFRQAKNSAISEAINQLREMQVLTKLLH